MRCPSVRLSVRLSRWCILSKRINIRIFNFFNHRVVTPIYIILVFCTKRYGNIPMGNPLMGASNANGVGKMHDFRPIHGFQIDDTVMYDQQYTVVDAIVDRT